MFRLLKDLSHRLKKINFFYTQKYNRIIRYCGNSLSKRIMLSFDDGPHPEFTTKILGILNKYSLKAVFFMSGSNVESYPDIARSIFLNGHDTGNHSYDHISLENFDPVKMATDLENTTILLCSLTGQKDIKYFRPPYGKNSEAYIRYIRDKNAYSLHWTLDSYDYKNGDAEKIANSLLKDIKNGDIVLLHDTREHVPEVLERIIPELIRRGFKFIKPSDFLN
jgi:peptidoglycan-N-acetylglucosamine deacetylase